MVPGMMVVKMCQFLMYKMQIQIRVHKQMYGLSLVLILLQGEDTEGNLSEKPPQETDDDNKG